MVPSGCRVEQADARTRRRLQLNSPSYSKPEHARSRRPGQWRHVRRAIACKARDSPRSHRQAVATPARRVRRERTTRTHHHHHALQPAHVPRCKVEEPDRGQCSAVPKPAGGQEHMRRQPLHLMADSCSTVQARQCTPAASSRAMATRSDSSARNGRGP